MEPTTLQMTWFVLLGVLMAGYAILDGFDLGVGRRGDLLLVGQESANALL